MGFLCDFTVDEIHNFDLPVHRGQSRAFHGDIRAIRGRRLAFPITFPVYEHQLEGDAYRRFSARDRLHAAHNYSSGPVSGYQRVQAKLASPLVSQ